MTIWIVFAVGLLAHGQYLANEPAVGPLLEGIRFCVKEPMPGVQSSGELRWIDTLKFEDEVCARNVASVTDARGTWIIFENSAGQVRSQKVSGAIDQTSCREIKSGASSTDFNIRSLAETVALSQKKILLESEAARPARTTKNLLQFALCHGALNKLIESHSLKRILNRAEATRITNVHRPPDIRPDSGLGGR